MCSEVWETWRHAERLQGDLGMDPEQEGPDDGHPFKALIVEKDRKHLGDGRSNSWDPLIQALETARALPLAPVCVVVSDESTLTSLLMANTHAASPEEIISPEDIIRRLGVAIYEHRLKAAFAFAPDAPAGALEICDTSGHRLVVVTRRRSSEGYNAVAVRRSRWARWRSGPALLSPPARRSHRRAPVLTLG